MVKGTLQTGIIRAITIYKMMSCTGQIGRNFKYWHRKAMLDAVYSKDMVDIVYTNVRFKLVLFKFKLYLFYNDYETSYTTYINHARWHRCLRSDGLRVGGNRNARKKSTCLTW